MSDIIDAKTTGRFEAKFREVYQTGGGGNNAPRIILKYYGTANPKLEGSSAESKDTRAGGATYYYATCDNMTFEEAWDILSKGGYIDAVMFIDGAKFMGHDNLLIIEWAKAVNVGIFKNLSTNDKIIGIAFVPTATDLIAGMVIYREQKTPSVTFYWLEDGTISTN